MANIVGTKLERKGNGIKPEDAIAFFLGLNKSKISSGIHSDAGQKVVLKAAHTEFGTSNVGYFSKGWSDDEIPVGFDKPYGSVKHVPPRPAIRMFLYQDMRDNITEEFEVAIDREKKSKLRNPKNSADDVLNLVGQECVVMQRNKMANGGFDETTNNVGLDPEHNGQRTIDYKGFDKVWVQTGETIASVSYKVSKK